MAESMINRIALLYKKAKSSAWGRTFKSDSERNYYIAEYLVKNDVVEVVRCKDCDCCNIYYPRKDIGKEPEPVYYCDALEHYTKPTNFCCNGKRTEVANNG